MRCNKLTLLFLIVFLALTFIQTTLAPDYHLPKNTTIKSGLKVHFGPYWISTTGTPITITTYFIDNWLNYTSNAGTQQIYNGTKPEKVYFDDVEQTEGTTWSCSGAVVTITPPGTDVAVLWGAGASDNPPTYSNVGSDETQAGESCTLSSLWDDDNGLSIYKVEHNNTGTLQNITDVFSGTPAWASETITLNSTVGVVVAWRTHGNDTINQWNTTSWQYITVTESSGSGESSSSSWIPFLDFIWAGDYLGFIQAVYVSAFQSADLFWGIMILLFMAPLYVRTRSLLLMSILWILLGSLFLVAMPIVSGLAILLLSFGIAGMFFKLFMRTRS